MLEWPALLPPGGKLVGGVEGHAPAQPANSQAPVEEGPGVAWPDTTPHGERATACLLSLRAPTVGAGQGGGALALWGAICPGEASTSRPVQLLPQECSSFPEGEGPYWQRRVTAQRSRAGPGPVPTSHPTPCSTKVTVKCNHTAAWRVAGESCCLPVGVGGRDAVQSVGTSACSWEEQPCVCQDQPATLADTQVCHSAEPQVPV